MLKKHFSQSCSILLLLALAGLTQADADADALPAASAEPTATPNAKAEPTYYPPAGAYHYGTAASAHTPALTPYNNYQHYQPDPAYGKQPHQAYHKPEPYHEPEPEVVLITETYPKQNCSVVDEAIRAEICVPDFQTKCGEEGLMNKRVEMGEFCYDVTRTVCQIKNNTEEIEVCKFEMEREEASSKAKTVEVEFKQECETQMVTVCEPVTYQPPPPPPTYAPPYGAAATAHGGVTPHDGYGYHKPPPPPPPPKQVYQQCKEVEQETCFNIPQVIEKEIAVTMGFPKPSKDCETRTVTIPEVVCEDVVESTCQDIPRIVSEGDSIENCQVEVGPPKCSEVELVLPKQICQDIVYGIATEDPVYEQPPAPAYVEQPYQPHHPPPHAAPHATYPNVK